MKLIIKEFRKYLNEIEFSEKEVEPIVVPAAKANYNFCKGKQNGTPVPQEIASAINPGDKSKYVCWNETAMPAEQAQKHKAGVVKKDEPAAKKPRTRREILKQDDEIRVELEVHDTFIGTGDVGAKEKWKAAVKSWQAARDAGQGRAGYKYKCTEWLPTYVYKTDTEDGFLLPKGDRCAKMGKEAVWLKCSNDVCAPAKPKRNCGSGGCKNQKTIERPKPEIGDFAGGKAPGMPFANVRGYTNTNLFQAPFWIPPAKGRWSATASKPGALQKAAAKFYKTTGYRVFPAAVAPGATPTRPRRPTPAESGHNSIIGFYAAKNLARRTRITKTPPAAASEVIQRQYNNCIEKYRGEEKMCEEEYLTQKTKAIIPKGSVYKLLLVRDDKGGFKFILSSRAPFKWPK